MKQSCNSFGVIEIRVIASGPSSMKNLLAQSSKRSCIPIQLLEILSCERKGPFRFTLHVLHVGSQLNPFGWKALTYLCQIFSGWRWHRLGHKEAWHIILGSKIKGFQFHGWIFVNIAWDPIFWSLEIWRDCKNLTDRHSCGQVVKTLDRCLFMNLSSHSWDHSQTIPSFHGNSLAWLNLCQNHNRFWCRIFVGHSTRTTWGSNPRYIFQKVTCASKIFAPIPKAIHKKGKQTKSVMVLDPYLSIGSMLPFLVEPQPFLPIFAKACPIHYCTTLSSQAEDTTCGFILCMCSDGGIHPIASAFWHRPKLLFSSSILVCSRGLHLSNNHTEQRCTTHGRAHVTCKKSRKRRHRSSTFWNGSPAIQLSTEKYCKTLWVVYIWNQLGFETFQRQQVKDELFQQALPNSEISKTRLYCAL